MPEPITIVVGVISIVGNVWNISRDLYELIDGIINAPRNIIAISNDVQALYVVLGTLQDLFHDVKDGGRLHAVCVPVFETLQQPLDNCLSICKELSAKLEKYTKPAGGIRRSKRTAFRWQFTEKKTDTYRRHLAAYKSTVTIAITSANYANTSQNLHMTSSLEAEIQAMRIQVQRLEFDNDQIGSVDGENGSQGTDRLYCLHQFMVATESVFSFSPPGSPRDSISRDESPTPRPSTPPPKAPDKPCEADKARLPIEIIPFSKRATQRLRTSFKGLSHLERNLHSIAEDLPSPSRKGSNLVTSNITTVSVEPKQHSDFNLAVEDEDRSSRQHQSNEDSHGLVVVQDARELTGNPAENEGNRESSDASTENKWSFAPPKSKKKSKKGKVKPEPDPGQDTTPILDPDYEPIRTKTSSGRGEFSARSSSWNIGTTAGVGNKSKDTSIGSNSWFAPPTKKEKKMKSSLFEAINEEKDELTPRVEEPTERNLCYIAEDLPSPSRKDSNPATSNITAVSAEPKQHLDFDLAEKRRNVFRRALIGLSSKSSNELANIEAILVERLRQVESKKGKVKLEPDPGQDTTPILDPDYELIRTKTSSGGGASCIRANRLSNIDDLSIHPASFRQEIIAVSRPSLDGIQSDEGSGSHQDLPSNPATSNITTVSTEPKQHSDFVLAEKRRNVFRRALIGLSPRSPNELAKIEAMLVELLEQVEGLKDIRSKKGKVKPEPDPGQDSTPILDPDYELIRTKASSSRGEFGACRSSWNTKTTAGVGNKSKDTSVDSNSWFAPPTKKEKKMKSGLFEAIDEKKDESTPRVEEPAKPDDEDDWVGWESTSKKKKKNGKKAEPELVSDLTTAPFVDFRSQDGFQQAAGKKAKKAAATAARERWGGDDDDDEGSNRDGQGGDPWGRHVFEWY